MNAQTVYFLRLQKLAESVCQLALSITQADAAALLLVDPFSDDWQSFSLDTSIDWLDTLNLEPITAHFKKNKHSWAIHNATRDWRSAVAAYLPYPTIFLVPQVGEQRSLNFLVLAAHNGRFDSSTGTQLEQLMSTFAHGMKAYTEEEYYSRWLVKLWYAMEKKKSTHDLLHKVIYDIRKRFKADAVAIWPYDYNRMLTKDFKSFERGALLKPGEEKSVKFEWEPGDDPHYSTVEQIVENRWLYVPDIEDPQYDQSVGKRTRQLCNELGVKAFCGLTLHIAGRGARGILFIYYKQTPAAIDRQEIQRFSDYVASGIEMTWRRLHAHRLRSILESIQTLTPLTLLGDRDKVLNTIAAGVRDSFECDIVNCYLYDPDKEWFYARGSSSIVPLHEEIDSDPQLSDLLKTGIERKTPRYIRPSELKAEKEKLKPRQFATKFTRDNGISAYALVPLHYNDNPIGVLFISYTSEHIFTEDEQTDIKLVANLIAMSLNSMQDFTRLGEERLTIGARMTQRWLSNVSSTWGHEVKRYASYINDRVSLIQAEIETTQSDANAGRYESIVTALEEIQENASKIHQMELFSPPLKIEENYTKLEIKRFLKERIQQWRQSTLYNALSFEWDPDVINDGFGVQGDALWLRWAFDIVVSYIRRLSESSRQHITIVSSIQPDMHLWIEFRYSGEEPPKSTWKRLHPIQTIQTPGEEEFDLVIAQTILLTYQGSLQVVGGDMGNSVIVDLPVVRLDTKIR